METKKPWQSKTLVLNGVSGLVLFVALFLPQAHVVSDFISAHGVEVGVAWSVLNVLLRAITKDKISLVD